jgi:phage-related protein
MNVGALYATFSVDAANAERGINQSEASMHGLERTAEEAAASIRRDMEELGAEHATPHVDVDDRGARTQLDELRARLAEMHHEDVAARVHVDIDGAAKAATELEAVKHEAEETGHKDREVNGLGAAFSGLMGPLGAVGAFFTSMPGMVTAAIPAVAGLAAAVAAIAPAAAVSASGLLAVASAGAAIKIGTSGIGAALKAAFAPPSGGAAAANTAQQIADAQRNLKDAITNASDANIKATQAVGDAQRNLSDAVQASTDTQIQAIRTVAMAERDLTDAQKSARLAQLDLNQARKQATQDLEDLDNQVKDAELAQREGILQLHQAKIALDQTMRSPQATQAAREQAQLSYDQAVQHMTEQNLGLERLKDKQAKAAQAGVEGSQLVIAAQDKLTLSQREVGDKQQALADDQKNSQRQVALAVRKVGDETRALEDAQKQQAKTAYQGAEQVQKAQEALAQAQRQAGAAAAATADALARLSPHARAFVQEIMRLKPALEAVKFDVQQRMFDGLAGSLRTAAGAILPVLHTRLVDTAGAINTMGRGVLETAGHMADSGILGQALGSANRGLASMSRIPGDVVQGFMQIGAAAGPAFERISAGAAGLAQKISDRLSAAFASGGMQRAIDLAVQLLGQLEQVVDNVGKMLGEVLGAAQQTGGGFIGTLVKISDAMAKAFATPAVQSGLRALFSTMSTLASTAAPLLGQALQVVGPVLAALGPPVQTLIQNLGAGLSPIISALGPVLLAGAQAVGQLLDAVSPLLPIAGQLIAQLGPILTPILQAVGTLFQQWAPYVAKVGQLVQSVLSPVLAVLPTVLQPILDMFTSLTGTLFPIAVQLLDALQPSIGQLTSSFVQIAVALAPVLTQLGQLIAQGLQAMAPLIPPIIGLVGQLASMFAGELALQVQQIVIPALRMLSQLLSGDVSGAFGSFKQLVVGILKDVVREFLLLPAQIVMAIGDLGLTLWDKGQDLVRGLMNGILSMGSWLWDKLTSWAKDAIPGPIAKALGINSPSRVMAEQIGRWIPAGVIAGIDTASPALQQRMATLVTPSRLPAFAGAPGMATAGTGGHGGFHIQNYYESETGSARSTAEELLWLGKGRG